MDVKDETQFEYTISNFTACCRICLSTKENEPYYDIYLTSLASYQEITLIEAIQRITNVEVLTNSKLPSKICKLCSARLDDAYCLARDFIRINEMLHNYLDNEVMDRDDGGDINLTTIEELCGLDVPEEEVKGEEQQLEGMIESELPPQQVDDQSEDSKQQQQQPDNQSDCAELQHQQPSEA
uniref:ZAD domain-containing protein n=1 Tax=Anopheles epiroticus TaxID=199890 RepID=A0A182PQ09_9DIPT